MSAKTSKALLSAALALSLPGCAHSAQENRAAMIDDHPCKPEPVQSLVGRLLDKPTIATALRLSGASIDRVVRAGEPLSMDHVTSRLTIEVDGANRILGLYCN